MRLKGRLPKAEFEKLGTDLKDHYELDGEYAYLKEGETENVDSLKSALNKEKEQRESLVTRLEAFKDVDPVKYKEAVKSLEQIEKMQKEVDEKIANAVGQVQEKHLKETRKLTERNTFLMSSLEAAILDANLITSMSPKVLVPRTLLPHARKHVKMFEENGEFIPRVVDNKGNIRISQKSKDNEPMTFDELVDELGTQEDYKPLFKASPAHGGGATGDNGGKPPQLGAPIRLSRDDAKDPAKYRAAKEAAEKANVDFIMDDSARPTG